MGPEAIHAHRPQAQPALGATRDPPLSLPRSTPRIDSPRSHACPRSPPLCCIAFTAGPRCIVRPTRSVHSFSRLPAERERDAKYRRRPHEACTHSGRTSRPRYASPPASPSPSSTLRFFAPDSVVTPSRSAAPVPAPAPGLASPPPCFSAPSAPRFVRAAAALEPAGSEARAPSACASSFSSCATSVAGIVGDAAFAGVGAGAFFFPTTTPGSVLRLAPFFLGGTAAGLGAAAFAVEEEEVAAGAAEAEEVEAAGRGGESEAASAEGGGGGATRLWTALCGRRERERGARSATA